MRILLTSFSFFVTLIVGAVAFALTAIEFPGIMRELIAYAQRIPGHLSTLGLSDSYMVWMDVLLTGDKLVLLGFVLVTRIIFAIFGAIFSRDGGATADGGAPRSSPFNRWG